VHMAVGWRATADLGNIGAGHHHVVGAHSTVDKPAGGEVLQTLSHLLAVFQKLRLRQGLQDAR
jgi:hypothetical protein